jgi:hypothetical protein
MQSVQKGTPAIFFLSLPSAQFDFTFTFWVYVMHVLDMLWVF